MGHFGWPSGLSHSLINIHDACSEFGSHADISSFFHRLERKEIPNTNQDKVLVHYFQFPRNPEEYRFYYIVTLQAFYNMFMIFKLFLDKSLRIVDPEWEKVISVIGPELEKLRKFYYSRFANDP